MPIRIATAALSLALFLIPSALHAQVTPPSSELERLLGPDRPVGYLSANPYLPGSTSAPGARYGATSPANPYGTYGSAYSRDGARNAYTTGGLEIYAQDGTYLGRLNANRYDPESVSNPYGRYGSRYSSQSINNPYGTYGSEYSPQSATNPYASSPPALVQPRTDSYGLPPLPPIGGGR